MDIEYTTDDLEELCMDSRRAARKLGPQSAKKLRSRYADLVAADCVHDLIAGRPHPLKGNRRGQFAVSLSGGDRLVFEPSQNPYPITDDGGIDWKSVTSVRIVEIGDYH